MRPALILFVVTIAFFILIFGRWVHKYTNNENVNKTNANANANANNTTKVAIATCIRKPVDFSLWLKHHRAMGVSRFYIRVEDTPELEDYLATQLDVVLEMGESDKTGNNYTTIQTRQVNFVNQSLHHATNNHIDWMFNIDCDELLHGSFDWLSTLDKTYKTVKLRNVEAVYDGTETHCFSCKRFRKCGENGVKCRAYANGKGGGRAISEVTQLGCHDFCVDGKHQGAFVYNASYDELYVLHFDSCSFGAWAEKFKHMSNNQQSEIPFEYYHESMGAVKRAWEIYSKYTQPTQDVGEMLTIP